MIGPDVKDLLPRIDRIALPAYNSFPLQSLEWTETVDFAFPVSRTISSNGSSFPESTESIRTRVGELTARMPSGVAKRPIPGEDWPGRFGLCIFWVMGCGLLLSG
jgi:hypothetical protein